jgi:Spy/CpxP family protein refolding chaperone
MKKLVLVFALVLGVSVASMAQNGGSNGSGRGGRMNPERQVNRLKEQLTLTDDQVAKVTTILTAQAALRNATS